MRLPQALAATGALALAIAMSTTAASSAAATTTPPPLSKEAAAAMLRDLGLNYQDAVERLKHEYAAAKTDAKIRSTLGSSYSGSWIDGSGKLHVRTSSLLGVVAVKVLGAEPVLAIGSHDPVKAQKLLDKVATAAPSSVTSWYVDEPTGTLVVETTKPSAAEAFVARAHLPKGLVQTKQWRRSRNSSTTWSAARPSTRPTTVGARWVSALATAA